MSWDCRWPLGCSAPTSLVRDEGREDGFCFYHWKVYVGLIIPDHVVGKALPGASRKRRKTHVPAYLRPFVDPSGVITEERLVLAEALAVLGASEETIRAAMAKPLVNAAETKEGYGSGVRKGTWAGPGEFGQPKPHGQSSA
ncbi:MAG: hypothetical protein ACREKK_08085 [Candidatus Methylomirabilales bacterium]